MKYLAPIDPHVHLRGDEYPDHDFLEMGLNDAYAVGLAAVLEMPNTTPPIDSPACLTRRHKLVWDRFGLGRDRNLLSDVPYYDIHPALTTNSVKAREMLDDLCRYTRRTPSDKTYYVDSTGDLGVTDPDFQRWIWRLKGAMGYRGVSMGHFEDQTIFTGDFDPADPVSHSIRQNESAEVLAVERQLRNAHDAGFAGTFYVCHASSPATVELVHDYKNGPHRQVRPFDVVVEVTPHCLFLNTDAYGRMGNLAKVNPPLRPPASQVLMQQHLVEGHIDLIGTDHAPHPLERKRDPRKPASGLPGLPYWPKLVERLHDELQLNRSQVDNLTFHAANRVFRLGLTPREVDVAYDPTLWEKYGYNPYVY